MFHCHRDFAYPTIKDRLPVILSKIVDTVYRSRDEVESKYGEVSHSSWDPGQVVWSFDLLLRTANNANEVLIQTVNG